MANKINLYKKNNFWNKKKLMITGLAAGAVTIPLSIALPVASIATGGTYTYNGLKFKSLNDAVEYVKSNSEKTVKSIGGYDAKWSINVDGKVQTFSSSNELLLSIYDQYIKSTMVSSSVNLSSYANENGELFLNNDLLSNIYKTSEQAAKVYQGLNDVAYNTEEQAYNSYFTVADAYYFDGVYFSSRNDLYNYLINVYLPNNNASKSNVIVISGPNGINSSPINLNDKNAYDAILSFIANNAISTLTYTNPNGESFSLNEKNIDKHLDKISINDLDYIHVQSNEGQSRYVIDNDSSDAANLIGPYFYDGVLDVGSFKNKDMWKKVRGVTNQVYVESKVDTMIGSFFSSIINDDSALILSEASQNNTAPTLFRTLLVDENLNPYDEVFLTKLKELSPLLYNELIEANTNLLKGKKYNTFYKFSILYNFMMQRIVSWNLNQNVINLVVEYFTNVGNFIQDAIELVVVDKSLLISADGKKTFNFVDFFNVGNPEYDLNSTCETFMNQLKTDYPKFVAAMHSYIAAQNNVLSLGGLIPYQSIDGSYLIEYGIISQQDLNSISQQLKNIYDIFSQTNVDDMIGIYSKSSSNPEIKLISQFPKEQWFDEMDKILSTYSNIPLGTMLASIGTKNSNYHDLSRASLELEIKTYLDTGVMVKYGYLSKLYSSNPRYDRLELFLQFITKYPEQDSYKVFLAMLIDKRMNTQIFNEQNTSDPYELAKAIARLVTLGLGSAALAGNAISKIHINRSSSSNARGTEFLDDWWFHEDGDDIGKLGSGFASPLSKIIDDEKIAKSVSIDSLENKVQSKMFLSKSTRTGDGVINGPVHSTPLPQKQYAQLINIEDLNKNIMPTPNIDTSKIQSFDGSKKQFVITSATNWLQRDLQKSTSGINVKEKIREYNDLVRRSSFGGTPSYLPPEERAMIINAMNGRREEAMLDIVNRSVQNDDYYFSNKNRPSNSQFDPKLTHDQLTGNTSVDESTGNNGQINGSDSNNSGSNNNGNTGNVGNGGHDGGDGTGSGGLGGSGSDGNNNSAGSSGSGSGGSDSSRPSTPDLGGTDSKPQNIEDLYAKIDKTKKQQMGSGAWDRDWSRRWSTVSSASSDDTPPPLPPRPPLDDDDVVNPNPGGDGSRPTTPDNNGSRPTTPDNNVDSNKGKNGKSYGAFKQRMAEWWSGSSSKFDSVKRAGIKIASHALEILGGAFMAMEMFFIIYELLRVEKIQDFYVYTTIDGTQFIWDGGLTTSKYFGFEVKEVHSINEMILVDPIQITLPQIEEYYYFSETKYYDGREMKKAAVKYMLSGGMLPTSNAFEFKYSLSSNDSSFKHSYSSMSELLTMFLQDTGIVINEDKTIDYSKLNTKSEFLLQTATSLGDGFLVSPSDNNVTLARNISNSIRATKLTILPETINNIADGKLSTNNIIYPGNYWNGKEVIKQDPMLYTGKILADNSANNLKVQIKPGEYIKNSYFTIENAVTAENESKNLLYNNFKSSFLLKDKNVLNNELSKNNFSSMNDGKYISEIFTITLNGKTRYFADKESAINYFLKMANFKKISDEIFSTIYYFEDQCFESEKEISSWIEKNF